MEHALDLKQLSQQAFAELGLQGIAYVKPTIEEGVSLFAIYAADGTRLGLVQGDRDFAAAAVRQHDLEPVSVH